MISLLLSVHSALVLDPGCRPEGAAFPSLRFILWRFSPLSATPTSVENIRARQQIVETRKTDSPFLNAGAILLVKVPATIMMSL